MLKRVALSLALLIVGAVSHQLSAQVEFHSGSTTELFAKAKSNNKLIFVDLYATWCPPCKAMERDVFSREDVGNFMAANFVCAKYSVDESIGNGLADQFEVSSIPTYLIFDSEGELIGRRMGSMSADEFIETMTQLLKRSEL